MSWNIKVSIWWILLLSSKIQRFKICLWEPIFLPCLTCTCCQHSQWNRGRIFHPSGHQQYRKGFVILMGLRNWVLAIALCMSKNTHSLGISSNHYMFTQDLLSSLQVPLLEIFAAHNIMVLQRHCVFKRSWNLTTFIFFFNGA